MSANLHVVLSYDSLLSSLIAEFYNENNIPNSALPIPFTIVATYRFLRNGVLFQEITGGDRVVLPIPAPKCTDSYTVVVLYTANAIVQPASINSIIIGTTFVYGTFLTQTTIPGGVVVNLTLPTGLVASNIEWAYNYKLFNPQPINPNSVVAKGNGIYEVKFVDLVTGLKYYAAVEVTGSTKASYLKIVGNNGSIFGLFGTPRNIFTLYFYPIGARDPIRNKVYVNRILYSDNPFVSLVGLRIGDLIDFVIIDCCDIVLKAKTFILPC